MQRLGVSGAVRAIYGSLGVKSLNKAQAVPIKHWGQIPKNNNTQQKVHTGA